MVESLQKELIEGQSQIMILKDQIMTMSLELANLDAFLPSMGAGVSQPVTSRQQLVLVKSEYAILQGKYSENHPDIKRLKRQIKSLEAELATSTSDKKTEKSQYKSPLYLKINSKIDSSEREVRRLFSRKNDIREKLGVFEKRVAETHQIKRAYNDLIRDYDNNLAKYKELRAKELQASLSQNLEAENKGESFTLIEPPSVANKPEKPNRPKILVMGVIASIGVGLGLALLFDILVSGVRGYSEIGRILGASPLVVVPLLTTEKVIVKKVRSRYKRVYWLLALIVLIVVCFHFLVMDLEIFWFKLLRKISFL